MLKKIIVLAGAALLAPTVASLIAGAWIGAAELKYAYKTKKLDAKIAAKMK